MTDATATHEAWLREVTTSLGRARVPCGQCSMNEVCGALTDHEDDPEYVQRGRIGSGKVLFRAGDRFNGVFAVTSGAVKTFAALEANVEQVVDFHFPGDTVGLEALDRGVYSYTAQALGETLVCRIATDKSAQLDEGRRREFQSELIRALGEQLRHEQSLSILLRNQAADQRIATFLLSLAGPSLWTKPRGVDLQLPMSRKDIANYLGVAVETLCRLLKRMQQQGLLKSSGRRVTLLDVNALSELARPTATGGATGDMCPA